MIVYWYRLYDNKPQAEFIVRSMEITPWAFINTPLESVNIKRTKKSRYMIVCKV